MDFATADGAPDPLRLFLLWLEAARGRGAAEPGTIPPRPRHHAGFVLAPSVVEFWAGEPDGLHRRVHYSRERTGWAHWRLQP